MIRAKRLVDALPDLACGLPLAMGILAGMLLELPRSANLSQLTALSQPMHLTITARDLEPTVRWYQEKLGFARLDLPTRDGKPSHVLLVRAGTVIEMRQGAGSDASVRPMGTNVPASGDVDKIALQLDDIDAETAALKEQGVEVIAEPRDAERRNVRVSIIRDPDGRSIELQEAL